MSQSVRRVAVFLSLILTLSLSGQALAQATPVQALERLMTEEIQAEWFSPLFLSHVTVEQLKAIIAQMASSLGEYEGVSEEGGEYLIHFTNGILPAQISLDAQGKIQGLFFHPPRPKASGFEEVVAQLAALPGKTHLLVVSEEGVLAAHNADAPLAVGSAFKLAVLAALLDQIEAGERSWDDVVLLTEEAKSLPTGILQNWPAGSPLTLHTAASLMISLSDNTATDLLISVVGRENVEKYSLHNAPLLTTREAFVLKDPANAELLAAYRAAGPEGRREMLASLARLPLPQASIFAQGEPVATDVEWFFSAYELCSLMARVQDQPLMGINPGVARPADWQKVAYKGGSEPGVLSLVTGLVGRDGKRYCVAATWNDEAALDEVRFFGIYSAILDVLAQASAAQ